MLVSAFFRGSSGDRPRERCPCRGARGKEASIGSNVVELPIKPAPKASGLIEKWEHGYVRRDKRGRVQHYICTMAQIPGATKSRFDFPTGASTLADAFKAWERFLADPDHFSPKPPPPTPPEPPLILSAELVLKFLVWSRDVKHNSDGWVACQRQCLSWWSARLGETNLRVTGGSEAKRHWLKQHFDPARVGAKGWGQKVAVLSAFYSWLRRVAHELTADTDPLFGAIERPPPSKPSLTKEAITEVRFREIRAQLADGPYRWAFDVLMATGRHVAEVCRFAAAGAIEGLPAGRPARAEGLPKASAVLALPLTKAGVSAWVAVSAAVAESARKLRVAGGVPPSRDGKGWETALYDACEAADLEAGRLAPTAWRMYQAELAGAEPQAIPTSGLFQLGWARRTLRTFASSKRFVHFVDAFQGHAKGTGAKFYDRAVPFKVPTMT